MIGRRTRITKKAAAVLLVLPCVLRGPYHLRADELCCPSVGGAAAATVSGSLLSVGQPMVGSVQGSGTDWWLHAGVMHCYALTEGETPIYPIEVELVGVRVDSEDPPGTPDQPFRRCITFIAKNESQCSSPVSREVIFRDDDPYDDSWATVITGFYVEEGDWTELCAKDKQHTLYSTTSLTPSGNGYEPDNVLRLDAGDTDDQSDVGILDVETFMSMFGSSATDGGCPWDGAPDADFSNNGTVLLEDYTFLAENWGKSSSCTCPPTFASAPDGMARTVLRVSVPVSELEPSVGDGADFTNDGVVDYRDVEIFELSYGLSDALSSKMKASTLLGAPATRERWNND